MSKIRAIIRGIPGMIFLYHQWIALRYRFSSTEKIFTRFYHENHWGSKDSKSGPGSDLSQTKVLVRELPGLFSRLKIGSVLDIPCGDFYWMQHVELGGIDYTGADIVEKMIRDNKEKFETEKIRFIKADLISDPLPKAGLVFCRDCLVHLSYADIRKALANIRNSGATYLLATTFDGGRTNRDIVTGEWRPIDLTASPFNLPEPILLIDEECMEADGAYRDKKMGLWKTEDLNISF